MWLLAWILSFSSCIVGRLGQRHSWAQQRLMMPKEQVSHNLFTVYGVPASSPLLRKVGLLSVLLLGPMLLPCYMLSLACGMEGSSH